MPASPLGIKSTSFAVVSETERSCFNISAEALR